MRANPLASTLTSARELSDARSFLFFSHSHILLNQALLHKVINRWMTSRRFILLAQDYHHMADSSCTTRDAARLAPLRPPVLLLPNTSPPSSNSDTPTAGSTGSGEHRMDIVEKSASTITTQLQITPMICEQVLLSSFPPLLH